VLQTLVPVFAEFYENRESWDFLRDNPQNWNRIWRLSHSPPGVFQGYRPRPRRGRPRGEIAPPGDSPVGIQLLRWMRQPERGMLRDRLFLLDENRMLIAGAETTMEAMAELEPVQVDDQVVGWLGFAPMGQALPPEAGRFLTEQVRITAISFAIALVVSAALAYLLARTVSRPVRQLGDTIGKLSRGNFLARASVETRDEIGILAGHVNELAGTLEKNRTSRQRWMADIAHELRTPVAILKGEVEALADGIRPADERMSASLQEEIDQLSTLIDDLQTLALSDAGALDIRKEPVDLGGLISQSVALFRERLDSRGIVVDLLLDESITIPADQHRLRQLLHNLLENSFRYVQDNGQVRFTLSPADGTVQLLLEDSGPGLETEQMDRLFDRFYRVEGSRSRSLGGSGLGLSICKNIVEAHGGNIRAETSVMGGLKIVICLPA